ncbi:hypothetical protein LINPERPRIM_LOCUS25988, partial [Linum perenne]
SSQYNLVIRIRKGPHSLFGTFQFLMIILSHSGSKSHLALK